MIQIRPSSMPTIARCAGSAQLKPLFPESQYDKCAAEEGTAAHWVAEQTLSSYISGNRAALTSDFIGQQAPNGVVIDDEMAQGADQYVTDILITCNETGLMRELQIEQPVTIDRIYPSMSGTPDAYLFDAQRGILHVWDLKYGHRYVKATENYQLIAYATGIIDKLGINDEFVRVNLTIVQPRSYSSEGTIRTWSVMGSELRPHVNLLHYQAHKATQPNPECVSGEQCHYCRPNHCRTAINASYNAIEESGKLQIEMIPNEHLKVQLEIMKTAKDRICDQLTGLESQIESQILAGQVVPGLATDNPPGRLNWTKPDSEIIALGKLMNADLVTGVKLLTPTQAINKKLIDESVIKAYASRKPGKTKIVNSDESKAARVFGKTKR